jgi:hypothetical protein
LLLQGSRTGAVGLRESGREEQIQHQNESLSPNCS